MEETQEVLTASPECEISSRRIVNASRELVFKAWTDPYHLKNWWGPNGFRNTFTEFDLRPNGKWTFVMHGPDGGRYPNECIFIKIVEPELLAWNHISSPKFQFVARFERISETKTNVIFKMIFKTPGEADSIRQLVNEKNEENLDKLEIELGKMIAELEKAF